MSVKIIATLFNFHIHFNGFNFTRLLWKATVLDVVIYASKIVSDLTGYKKPWCLCNSGDLNYNPAVSTHIQQQGFSDSVDNEINSTSWYLTPCEFIATIQIEFSDQISINRTPFRHDWLIAVHALFLLTGRSDEISVNYLNHFYDCGLCGKKRECAGWCLPGITAILFCAQWWNRLSVERCASQLTSRSWTLFVLSHPTVFGQWPGKACPLCFIEYPRIDLRRCPP